MRHVDPCGLMHFEQVCLVYALKRVCPHCVCVCVKSHVFLVHILTAGPTNVHVSLLSGPVGLLSCCLVQECSRVSFLASLFWQSTRVLSVRGTHCRSQHVNVTLTATLQQLNGPVHLHTYTVKKTPVKLEGKVFTLSCRSTVAWSVSRKYRALAPY